jgi:hypothetical protein
VAGDAPAPAEKHAETPKAPEGGERSQLNSCNLLGDANAQGKTAAPGSDTQAAANHVAEAIPKGIGDSASNHKFSSALQDAVASTGGSPEKMNALAGQLNAAGERQKTSEGQYKFAAGTDKDGHSVLYAELSENGKPRGVGTAITVTGLDCASGKAETKAGVFIDGEKGRHLTTEAPEPQSPKSETVEKTPPPKTAAEAANRAADAVTTGLQYKPTNDAANPSVISLTSDRPELWNQPNEKGVSPHDAVETAFKMGMGVAPDLKTAGDTITRAINGNNTDSKAPGFHAEFRASQDDPNSGTLRVYRNDAEAANGRSEYVSAQITLRDGKVSVGENNVGMPQTAPQEDASVTPTERSKEQVVSPTVGKGSDTPPVISHVADNIPTGIGDSTSNHRFAPEPQSPKSETVEKNPPPKTAVEAANLAADAVTTGLQYKPTNDAANPSVISLTSDRPELWNQPNEKGVSPHDTVETAFNMGMGVTPDLQTVGDNISKTINGNNSDLKAPGFHAVFKASQDDPNSGTLQVYRNDAEAANGRSEYVNAQVTLKDGKVVVGENNVGSTTPETAPPEDTRNAAKPNLNRPDFDVLNDKMAALLARLGRN